MGLLVQAAGGAMVTALAFAVGYVLCFGERLERMVALGILANFLVCSGLIVTRGDFPRLVGLASDGALLAFIVALAIRRDAPVSLLGVAALHLVLVFVSFIGAMDRQVERFSDFALGSVGYILLYLSLATLAAGVHARRSSMSYRRGPLTPGPVVSAERRAG